MDKDRQIRFLYPPLVFVGFWLWALYLDPHRGVNQYLPIGGPVTSSLIAGIVAGGGVVILVGGFLISVFSVVVLRIGLKRFRKSHYEADLSTEALRRITILLGLPQQQFDADQALFLSAVFDHALLPDNVHTWMLRRWSSFNISVHSCTALIAVNVATLWSELHPGLGWYLVCCGSFVILGLQARFAWRDTMGMAEFYSTLDAKMLRYPNERPPEK